MAIAMSCADFLRKDGLRLAQEGAITNADGEKETEAWPGG